MQNSKQVRKAGKSLWWTLLIVLGVFTFLGISLWREWDTIVSYPWQLKWGEIFKMVLMHILALGFMFLAWHYSMRRLVRQEQWRLNFKIFGVSMLARRIPIPIWYVGSRVLLYRDEKVPASIVLTATAFEIALIAWSGILCYVILLPWYTYTQNWPTEIFILIAGLLSILLFIRPSLMVELINLALKALKKNPVQAAITRLDLLIWGTLYLATWFIDGMGLYYMVSAFLESPPAVASIIGVSTVSALIALATMLLPSGFGLKELAMGSMLGAWIPVSAGVVLSFLYRLAQTLVEAAWTVVGQRLPEPEPKYDP